MLGREVNTPVSLMYPLPHNSKVDEPPKFVADMKRAMESCHETARVQPRQKAKRQKRDYDVRIMEHQYATGDLVFKRNKVGENFPIL